MHSNHPPPSGGMVAYTLSLPLLLSVSKTTPKHNRTKHKRAAMKKPSQYWSCWIRRCSYFQLECTKMAEWVQWTPWQAPRVKSKTLKLWHHFLALSLSSGCFGSAHWLRRAHGLCSCCLLDALSLLSSLGRFRRYLSNLFTTGQWRIKSLFPPRSIKTRCS